ncbi:ROK family transcriptional regulator [Streptomyces longispororuber]|uniref:ROK family transcriptional regulator n=1 Tax=Streptomyces longispororuber TaxID=68230 RepID=UPI00210EEE29|nr:ROK family transcriptional regulator [Streptomyces longispororuber]MCQ4210753.1 ROK family transcriptional regulator [Streptomyces longispororuber]
MLLSRAQVLSSPAAHSVFTTVLTRGPVARPEIARITGLSSAAVTKAVRPLLDAGYLEELPEQERAVEGAGRPAHPVAVRADREFFVGVKVTAHELIGVVTDLRAQVRAARRMPVSGNEVDAVVADIAALVAELLPDFQGRTQSLGVSVSGDVDRAGGVVRYSPFLGWREVPLAELLGAATGLTTTVENDVKALTVAEQWFGEGVGADSFALVTVGAGIGCGLVVGGQVVAGGFGVAGEIGHIPVAAGSGPDCHCGGRGCVEAIASEQAIVARARAAAGDDALDLTGAMDRAHSGDTEVRAVFAEAGQAIGLGLAAVVNVVGPERVVVSGEGLAAYDLFEEQIRAAFATQVFGAAARCPLVVRPLPWEEWARGAAAVGIQSLFTA